MSQLFRLRTLLTNLAALTRNTIRFGIPGAPTWTWGDETTELRSKTFELLVSLHAP